MSDRITLDYCARCGGALELIEGTEPDQAARTGQFKEIYECQTCEKLGTFIVDYGAETERGSGVVCA